MCEIIFSLGDDAILVVSMLNSNSAFVQRNVPICAFMIEEIMGNNYWISGSGGNI